MMTHFIICYLKSCNDIVLFLSVDPNVNKNIDLDTKLIVNFKEESIHRIKDYILTNIEIQERIFIIEKLNIVDIKF